MLGTYLPGRCCAIAAQLFPSLPCQKKINLSSSSVHAPFFTCDDVECFTFTKHMHTDSLSTHVWAQVIEPALATLLATATRQIESKHTPVASAEPGN